MNIISFRAMLGAAVLCAIASNNAYPGAPKEPSERKMVTAVMSLKHQGNLISFPDVCTTPSPGGSVPIPYPNMIDKSSSEFSKGTKRVKGKGKIVIKESAYKTRAGDEAGVARGPASGTAYEVLVYDKAGRKITLKQSTLFELADGTYCAVCVKNGLLTGVLKLTK